MLACAREADADGVDTVLEVETTVGSDAVDSVGVRLDAPSGSCGVHLWCVWLIVALAETVGTMIEKCERTIGNLAFLSETTLTSRDK